eukprot:scaffold297_cov108-Isochrysis_galbana.AAC.5
MAAQASHMLVEKASPYPRIESAGDHVPAQLGLRLLPRHAAMLLAAVVRAEQRAEGVGEPLVDGLLDQADQRGADEDGPGQEELPLVWAGRRVRVGR